MYESGFLFIVLHSSRRLAYVKPKIGVNQFGGESVTYEGVGVQRNGKDLKAMVPSFVKTSRRQSQGIFLCMPCKL